MKKLAALLGIALLWVVPALAQSPVSPATTLSDIAIQLPTNNTGRISAQTLRGVLGEMVSNFMPLGVNKNVTPWQVCAWSTSILCSGTIGTIDPTTGTFTASGGGGSTPGGSPGQIQSNFGGVSLSGFTVNGDATLNTASGLFTINPGAVTGAKLATNAAAQNLGFNPVSSASLGVANGTATLDSNGFVPIGQLPPAVAGGLAFQGSWNANTNSPALTSSVGTIGQYYFVSVSGSTTLNGVSSWTVGDLVLYSSGIWNKIPGSGGSAVTQVAGLGPGVISGASLISALALTAPNIGGGNFPNSNFGFGAAVAPDSLVTINANSGATVAQAGQLHIVGADAGSAGATLDSFGNANNLIFRRSEGTRASKTALSGSIASILGYGWNGSVYNLAAAIGFSPAQTFTGSAGGSFVNFYTTPLNSLTIAEAGRFVPSGGFSVGTTTDNGIGSITANTGFWGDGSHLTGISAGSFTQSGAGMLTTTVSAKIQSSVPCDVVVDAGADPTGTLDSTAAIRKCIARGGPIYFPRNTDTAGCVNPGFQANTVCGYYLVTDGMVLSTVQQRLFGDGIAVSRIFVPTTATFPTEARGVLVATSGEPGPDIRGIGVYFGQPDSNSLAAMHTYPPAFYLQSTPRFVLNYVGCFRATTCVDMRGNSGGARLDHLAFSYFNIGVDIDGSLDTVHGTDWRFWVFYLTANQTAVFTDPGVGHNTGARLGRVDGFYLDKFLSYGGLGLNLITGTFGATAGTTGFGTISLSDFDSENGVFQAAGNWKFVGDDFTIANNQAQAFVFNGGNATIGSSRFFLGAASTIPLLQVAGPGNVTANSPIFQTSAFDTTSVSITNGSGLLNITGANFQRNANTAYTAATINQTAGRILMSSSFQNDKGTGAGTFMALNDNGSNRVIGNSSPGWTNTVNGGAMASSLTPTGGGGIYAGN